MKSLYHFQLLRYSPNRLAEEFYNIAVLLYGPDGKLVEARFTPDFRRLRCHPLADLQLLEHLRSEFESRQFAEGFQDYVEELRRNLSQGLHLSEERVFEGGEPPEEIARLERTYLATPKRSEVRAEEPAPGTRRWILRRLRGALDLYHVLDRMEAEVQVGGFVSPRFSFEMDYAYRPDGVTRYIHALSHQHDMADAPRLCFVFDRIRAQAKAALTAVVDDALPEDTRALLSSSRIEPCPVSKLDSLALAIRHDLGL
jgi:hypothetical protein